MIDFKFLSLLLASLIISKSSFADSTPFDGVAQISDGLTKLSGNSAQVTGPDPYIILPVQTISERLTTQDHSSPKSKLIYLPLEISIPDSGHKLGDVSGELFFKYQDLVRNFDPNYKLRFNLHNEYAKQLVLTADSNLVLSERALRLDLDGCKDCIIKYGAEFQILSDDSELDGKLESIDPYRVHNGIRSLIDTDLPVDIAKLRLNHISENGNYWVISGGDPYFVTPLLDLDTTTLGGVIFSLSRTHPRLVTSSTDSLEIQDFQLFYATNSQAFLERESIIFRVVGQPSANGKIEFKFFVPLDFIKQGYGKNLTELRLDITSHGGLGEQLHTPSTEWNFESISLVSQAGLDSYKTYLPVSIARSTSVQSSARELISNITERLGKDLWFIIAYLTTLILLILSILRKLRLTNTHS